MRASGRCARFAHKAMPLTLPPVFPLLQAAKKIHLRFSIDCNTPMEDGIFDIESFEKFLHERIKINGKTGVLGDTVSIRTAASKVVIDSKTHFSKRYFKYLTKKVTFPHSLSLRFDNFARHTATGTRLSRRLPPCRCPHGHALLFCALRFWRAGRGHLPQERLGGMAEGGFKWLVCVGWCLAAVLAGRGFVLMCTFALTVFSLFSLA